MKKYIENFKNDIRLFVLFSQIGIQMLGNATTMIPILQRELIDKRSLIQKDDILDSITLARCGPGAAIINVVVYLGNKINGVKGGIIASLGFVFFPCIIIMLISTYINRLLENQMIKNAFMGILVYVTIKIIKSIIELWKSSIIDKKTFIIFIFAIILSVIFDVSAIILILMSSLIGIMNYFYNKKTNKQNKNTSD